MTRLKAHWQRALVAVLAVSLGALAISQTAEMSELGRVFPITASVITISAGLGVLVQLVLRSQSRSETDDRVDYVRAGLFALTMLIWALSLDSLGFEPTSGAAVFVLAIITRREPMSITSIVLHANAGCLLVLGFSLLLGEVLNVRLP